MRIGFYHDGAGTRHAGGIAVYTRRMATELARLHDVTVCTTAGPESDSLEAAGVEVIETPSFDSALSAAIAAVSPVGRQDVSKLRMAMRGARSDVFERLERRVDVLFTFQVLDDVLVSNLVDVPTIRGFHSDFTCGIGTAIRERYTNTEVHVANSTYLADRVADEFGYDVDAVIPPGVDVDRFSPDAEPAFGHDGPTVLFVGRLVASKGIFDLLDAIAHLDESVTLRIVGTGETGAVRRYARKRGVDDAVVFDGVIPHEDLPGYYAAADAFCLPTHAESFGMVNLEAMAAATPVVTTDLGGIGTYFRPETNGLAVPPGDPERIADAIGDLLGDGHRRRSLGARGRRRAREFTWRRQADRLASFCRRLLRNEQPGPEHERRKVATVSPGTTTVSPENLD